MHNAENCGLNAYESIPDIQDLYARPFYDPKDLRDAYDRLHEKATNNRVEILKDKLNTERKVKRNYRLGGTIIGAGIGYKIGAHYAKKTPIISQQRKRKLIGTILGTTGGLLIGNQLGNLHNKKLTKSKYDKKLNDNQAWEDSARESVKKRYHRRPIKEYVGSTRNNGPHKEPSYNDLPNTRTHTIKSNITKDFKSLSEPIRNILKSESKFKTTKDSGITYRVPEEYKGSDWKQRRRKLKKMNKLLSQFK
jgi:hypothetical protein